MNYNYQIQYVWNFLYYRLDPIIIDIYMKISKFTTKLILIFILFIFVFPIHHYPYDFFSNGHNHASSRVVFFVDTQTNIIFEIRSSLEEEALKEHKYLCLDNYKLNHQNIVSYNTSKIPFPLSRVALLKQYSRPPPTA